ncbi:PREDICTED: vegetative cell wall protein gp1-like isoform X2 [Ficedula albicollis]|uniref:vegetative cell wall protein gp1-like isoform X1 n=1 Tax=Ficedula albicollis TaxID=59894 RepID=UPI0007AD7931|nr:PREDICTED: vegetative cell wall protein gp1-like isoform X1 [Ficedula albicollis]XP_016159729.1 PREDICTED: vegetative cell wall protein gp1-like isoform X2 [Ficedula albicollis]
MRARAPRQLQKAKMLNALPRRAEPAPSSPGPEVLDLASGMPLTGRLEGAPSPEALPAGPRALVKVGFPLCPPPTGAGVPRPARPAASPTPPASGSAHRPSAPAPGPASPARPAGEDGDRGTRTSLPSLPASSGENCCLNSV